MGGKVGYIQNKLNFRGGRVTMTKIIVRVLNAVMDFLNDVAEWFYVDWF